MLSNFCPLQSIASQEAKELCIQTKRRKYPGLKLFGRLAVKLGYDILGAEANESKN